MEKNQAELESLQQKLVPLRKATMSLLIPDWRYSRKYTDLPGAITWKKQWIRALDETRKLPFRFYWESFDTKSSMTIIYAESYHYDHWEDRKSGATTYQSKRTFIHTWGECVLIVWESEWERNEAGESSEGEWSSVLLLFLGNQSVNCINVWRT